MAKENKTYYAILGLLNHEDMTGYEIKKRVDLSLRFFWNAGFGQIYPSLAAMEKLGWVQKHSDPAGDKIERIRYSITDKGREELLRWLSAPPEQDTVRYEILLKLFFGSALDPQRNIENIEAFGRTYAAQLPMLNAFHKELESITEGSPDHLYYLLTVMFGEKIYGAYLQWAEEAAALLKEKMSATGGKEDIQ